MIYPPQPPRPAGQQSVRGLRTEPLGTVRVALVGLGQRGQTALRLLALLPDTRITVLCDADEANTRTALQLLPRDSQPTCLSGPDAYLEACRREDVDLVYICTDWTSHAPIALAAMRAGKHAAVEVPAATTLDELWQLVDTAEQTRRHCFLLENCCFDAEVMNLVTETRNGAIGKPVHAEGVYYHCLGERWSDWRLEINRRQRGDLYPTHELGPICQALDVGGTDRLQVLTCMDSAALTGPQLYHQRTGNEAADFQNGDHTTTLLRTALGRTILLRHDVMTPQPYRRDITIVGTAGQLRAGEDDALEAAEGGCFRSVHDPMTYEMNSRLIHCLSAGLPLDISVYDLATWCAVIPLSRLSVENGYAPVEVPCFDRDF